MGLLCVKNENEEWSEMKQHASFSNIYTFPISTGAGLCGSWGGPKDVDPGV